MKSLNSGNKRLKARIFGVFAALILAVPVFVFSSHKTHLYVDDNAGGTRDGSAAHPYKSISEAVSHAKDKTEIHVAKGEYKENISLRDGIKIFGEDREKTIIKAKKGSQAVISMKNDSTVDGFTIKDGKRGIWVEKDAKASISDCVIKDNNDDGIGIEGGNTKKSNQVSISKTKIKNNDWSGIYVTGPRKISITDSEILNNQKGGIDLAGGVSAWIEGNDIKDNGGSGLKLVMDGSNIWTKNNDIRRNSREGIEVASYGGAGRINVSKSKIVENGLYGIARLQRAGHINWGTSLTLEPTAEIWGNIQGGLSKIFFIK